MFEMGHLCFVEKGSCLKQCLTKPVADVKFAAINIAKETLM